MKRLFKILIPFLVLVLIGAVWLAWYFNLLPKKSYTAADFGIETLVASVDFDGDGLEDYADLLAGAKAEAKRRPRYKSVYYNGGYPPAEEGVCTDVIWRAFRDAGYSLREMVDQDIRNRPDAYPNIQKPDDNIDFRRVTNLHYFLEEYGVELTTDIDAIESWQPGDIVVFGNNKHIGIVSDKRNKKGQPYILHNGGQPMREEDYLPRAKVTAHFRFDASKVPEELLIKFQ